MTTTTLALPQQVTPGVELPRAPVATLAPAPLEACAPSGVTDHTTGRAIAFGLTLGSLLMGLISFALVLASGQSLAIAAQVAPWPGLVAGLFFGSVAYFGVHLARQEQARPSSS